MLCTDITEQVLAEAVEKGCRMVVSHHPLLFKGLRQVTGQTPAERCVMYALHHGLVLYSAHTSLDNAADGISIRMAAMLSLREVEVLDPQESGWGLGAIGILPEPLAEQAFVARVGETFGAPVVRYVCGKGKEVRSVALCGGAGSSLLEQAVRKGADAYVSADFRYHELQAAEHRILTLDIGHFESERHATDIFRELLQPYVVCITAESDRSPVRVFCPDTVQRN